MSRDSGELLKAGFTLLPGNNGTFVIRATAPEHALRDVYGFTTVDDLLEFLRGEAEALKSYQVRDAQAKQPWAEP